MNVAYIHGHSVKLRINLFKLLRQMAQDRVRRGLLAHQLLKYVLRPGWRLNRDSVYDLRSVFSVLIANDEGTGAMRTLNTFPDVFL
jgi:hypothetical protein